MVCYAFESTSLPNCRLLPWTPPKRFQVNRTKTQREWALRAPPTCPRTPGRKRQSLVAVLESGVPSELPPFVFLSIGAKPTEGMHTRDTDLAASMSTPLKPELGHAKSTREGFVSISLILILNLVFILNIINYL
jgi:hypothetical protein